MSFPVNVLPHDVSEGLDSGENETRYG